MAAARRHTGRSAVSPMGSGVPRRRKKQSAKAASVEPPIQIVFSKPPVVKPIPQKVEEVKIPPPRANSAMVLGLAKKPVPESQAQGKGRGWERTPWGVTVAVSWTVTVVALLHLVGVV